MPKIRINGAEKEYEKGTTFEDIAKEYQKFYDDKIAAVMINGKIRELMKTVKKDGTLSFITVKDNIGFKTMRRTGLMILIKSVIDVTGGSKNGVTIKAEFTIGNGLYCTIRGVNVTKELVKKISEKDLRIESDHTYFDDTKIQKLLGGVIYKRLADFSKDI